MEPNFVCWPAVVSKSTRPRTSEIANLSYSVQFTILYAIVIANAASLQQASASLRNAPLRAPDPTKKPSKTLRTNVFEGDQLPRRDSNPN